MNSEKRAIAFASGACVAVGVIVTLIVWGKLGFDPAQGLPFMTLLFLCFVLTGLQALGPTPTCELEFLCGPRQVLMPVIAIGILWLFHKAGVDYSAFGALFSSRNPQDGYVEVGAGAGYFACQVYIGVAVAKYDSFAGWR